MNSKQDSTLKSQKKSLYNEIYKKAYSDCMKRLKDLAAKDDISLKKALELLSGENPQSLKNHSFVFEDFSHVDEMSLQVLIKTVDKTDIVLSLKQASPEVKQKFLNNMSGNAADMIKEEMGYIGPVRIKEAEEAQNKIIQVMRELRAKGEIL